MKQYINITFSVFLSLALLTSCEDMFEVEPEEVLLSEDYLGDNEVDARSALFGILSEMQDLTSQYLVLGEMRADLVDVNSNTTDEVRQISNHNIDPDNSYIDPVKLFSIINNCNYVLVGIDTEAKEGVLLEDYASVLRIRTWAQLQILIYYGELPYIDQPIRSDDDLTIEYPLLNFNQGLDQLIYNLQQIAGIPNVIRHDSFVVELMIPDNNILLGDLYLWRGDYIGAATSYKQFLDIAVNDGLPYLGTLYSVDIEPLGTDYIQTNRWVNMFEGYRTLEAINITSFNDEYRQPNNAFDIVTNQFKPSNSILLNWSQQFWGYNGEPVKIGDTRQEASLSIIDSEIIGKYQEEYFVWNRAAKVYLRYAEAINYAGYPEQALVALNGIFNNPDVDPVDAPIFNNLENFLNFDLDSYFVVSTLEEPESGLLGIRGRVGMAPVTVDPTLTDDETIAEVGKLILNEAALELAFEGNRWEDLVRFSKRANDPSIIADAVADKFETAGDAAGASSVRIKLSEPENWFLSLEIPSNFVTQE